MQTRTLNFQWSVERPCRANGIWTRATNLPAQRTLLLTSVLSVRALPSELSRRLCSDTAWSTSKEKQRKKKRHQTKNRNNKEREKERQSEEVKVSIIISLNYWFWDFQTIRWHNLQIQQLKLALTFSPFNTADMSILCRKAQRFDR